MPFRRLLREPLKVTRNHSPRSRRSLRSPTRPPGPPRSSNVHLGRRRLLLLEAPSQQYRHGNRECRCAQKQNERPPPPILPRQRLHDGFACADHGQTRADRDQRLQTRILPLVGRARLRIRLDRHSADLVHDHIDRCARCRHDHIDRRARCRSALERDKRPSVAVHGIALVSSNLMERERNAYGANGWNKSVRTPS